MAVKVKIKIEMQLPVSIQKKEKWFVSSCPILDVFSQGETEEQAKKNLIEALSLFLTSCYERGTFEAVLQQCGFKKAVSDDVIGYEQPASEVSELIDVPLYLLANNCGHGLCHA
jgi:predicted RNase H-like HicB family nuclease